MRWLLAVPLVALVACSSSSNSSSSGSSGSTTSSGSTSGTTGSTGSTGSSGSSGSGGSSGTTGDLCANLPQPCVAFTAGVSSENDIVGAFASAANGTTFVFGAGTFNFANSLTLQQALNDFTIQGAGMRKTILDFTGQVAGADGIDITNSTGVTIARLTIQNSAGNAVKVLQSSKIVFDGVETTWTTPHSSNNGPYGLYPVQSSDILIQNCVVSGASDSGVYVGQSQNIVVRANEVYGNVAGIEIENSFDADVYGNNAHDNTAGILVFDLPNLQQQGGHNVRVFQNTSAHNNLANFAVNGDIVSVVPAGSGMVLMANHQVEIFNNKITDNGTSAVGVISYYVTQEAINDPAYYPFPYDDQVHDNYLEGNGTAPSSSPKQPIGFLLANAQMHNQFSGGHVPDQIYDGIVDPAWAADAGISPNADGGFPHNLDVMNICFHGNGGDAGAATFGDLNAADLEVYLTLPDGGINPDWDGGQVSNLGDIVGQDGTAFDCTPTPQTSTAGGWMPDGGP